MIVAYETPQQPAAYPWNGLSVRRSETTLLLHVGHTEKVCITTHLHVFGHTTFRCLIIFDIDTPPNSSHYQHIRQESDQHCSMCLFIGLHAVLGRVESSITWREMDLHLLAGLSTTPLSNTTEVFRTVHDVSKQIY
jgi:hypothetical protein